MSKILLEAFDIEKYYAGNKIFSFDSLKIYAGDKIGLIGANGSGKTTLLNILYGKIQPDAGTVKRYCDISYITQFDSQNIEANKKLLNDFNMLNKQESPISGGEKMRLKLASAFSNEDLLIFADEPTSNLDVKGVEVFCEKMLNLDSFVLISHDRDILNKLCNKTIEIKDQNLHFYNGNYNFYTEESTKKQKNALLQYNNYIAEKSHLEAALTQSKTKSKSIRKAPKRMGNSEARLHKGSTSDRKKKLDKATSSLKSRLEKLEVKNKPTEQTKIKMDFSLTDPPKNKIVIHSHNLNFSYGNKLIFKDASFKIENGSKLALYGENGTGKTTLLNLISQNHKDISIVPKAKIGYFYQGFENIDFEKSILENAEINSIQNKTVIRTVLARLLFSAGNIDKPASVLSGGERIKLSFAKLFLSDANVLLLDEPTNYLDINSIEVLQTLLKEYEGTVIFVSHDKSFVDAVSDKIIIFENKKLILHDGNIDMYHKKVNDQNNNIEEIEKSMLQMKLTEIISKLSNEKYSSKKDELEAEYQLIINKLHHK